MKVLMFGWEFPPYHSGGLGTACYGLTKGLSKKDVSITFVLPHKVDLNVDFLKIVYGDETTGIKSKYIVNSLLSSYSSSASFSYTCAGNGTTKDIPIYGGNLLEEVERYGAIGEKIASMEEFDIIHAHDWLTYKAAIAAKKVSGKYLVVHIHNTVFDRGAGNGNPAEYKIEKEGFEAADTIIAVSNLVKNKVVAHYGISPEKVKVVHNAIDFENYALEQMHELKKSHKIVLFHGRLTLQKGPDYFVSAAKKILEFYPDVIFVVVGSGDMEKQIIRKVAELGIADKFIFTGWLRERKESFAAFQMADIFVMPSVSEPFGLAPLESIMSGTPALISNQSGVSEVLNHCLKVDFWDVDEMANKIVAVLKYDELRRCLKENGTEEIRKFSWDNPAGRCVDIYDSLLRGKN